MSPKKQRPFSRLDTRELKEQFEKKTQSYLEFLAALNDELSHRGSTKAAQAVQYLVRPQIEYIEAAIKKARNGGL